VPADTKTPVRVTYVLTHPVQYFAPWFRWMSTHVPEIELTVLYVTIPTDTQRGTGFGRPIDWGTPLLDGYKWRSVREAKATDSVRVGSFWGLGSKAVSEALAATKPDLVVVPGWHSAAYVRALLACRWRGIPALYRGDTHLGTAPTGLRRIVWRAKNRILLALFGGYLSVGTRSREFLLAHGVDSSRIFDSPHAVDNDFFATHAARFQEPGIRADVRREFGLPADAFVILMVGKLDTGKRPLDAIHAAARLGRATAMLIVGSGPLEDACRREAERLGVAVATAGFLDQPSLGRAYAAADCLVMPSASETWGLVVNEALATGLPCVVSHGVGCAPDLLTSPLVGRVYPVGDIGALATAIDDVRYQVERRPAEVRIACREAVSAARFERTTEGLLHACARFADPPVDTPAETARLLVCGGGMVTVGGSERVVFEVIRIAHERGAAVHVLVNDWGASEIIRSVESLGATWSYTWVRAPLRRSNLTPLGLVRYAWEFTRTSASLVSSAARFRPTVVLVVDYTTGLRNSFGLLALRALGIRIVMKLANAPEPDAFYRRIWRWLVNPLVSVFVCNSAFTEHELTACGISAAKIVRILNTTPTRVAVASPSNRAANRVVFVGQIIPEKGLEPLLDAVEILLSRRVPVTLDIVGAVEGWTPPEYVAFKDRLRARVSAAPLDGAVRMLGWREDVDRCLESAAVHCCPSLPSIRESFGLVVLEAKTAATPSVIFKSGALPELVTHQIDGWVCDEATPAALAQGLEYFLTDADRRAAAGRHARESLARFDRRTFADRWWSLISAPRRASNAHLAWSELR
jgi:glycosyltransferase involved in cell wall biosynthesis